MRLELESVSVSFGSIRALRNLSLQAGVGVLSLLGPNGAGKTTLMSVIAGTRRPDSGKMRVLPSSGYEQRLRGPQEITVGYLPQGFDLVSGMSAIDTVRYAAWCNLMPRKHLTRASKEALAIVELEDLAAARVRNLSGGQRQRLGLAAAMVHRPDVLLLDEPTVGFDPAQRARFRGYLRLIAPSTCVVIATHLLEDCQRGADRVVVLNRGQISYDGSVEALALIGHQSSGEVYESPLERGYRTVLDAGTPSDP